MELECGGINKMDALAHDAPYQTSKEECYTDSARSGALWDKGSFAAQRHASSRALAASCSTAVYWSGLAWNQLGNMSAVEAMRLYVRTLDEEQVWQEHVAECAP
eukprot:1145173-Pelagomonas_calceolata.AAC.1